MSLKAKKWENVKECVDSWKLYETNKDTSERTSSII